jgi:3-hydroxyisobutyrate dehydrogenase
MATNLLQAGHRVRAYNRSRDKVTALKEAGAAVLNSPREIVEQSDIVFIMLSDSHAIRSVLTQADGALEAVTPGKVIVNMSTIAPEDAVEFARLVSEGGGRYVDAPVSGSVGAAKAGQLVILAGGEEIAIEAAQAYFDILGKETIRFGATGTGSSAKLAINLLLGIMGQGIGEAVLLAEKSGVAKEKFLELISKSAMNTPFFQMKKDMYINYDFPAAFMVGLMSKDLGLVKAQANCLGTILPLAEAADTTYRSAKEHGKAALDMAAVYQELREQSEVKYFHQEGEYEMSDIIWPEQYLPGTTDNYVSNEIIVASLTAAEVWPLLNNTSAWPTYYSNASEIRFHDGTGPELSQGSRFRFTTFGFPVEAEVTEYEPPAAGKPARVAWHGWVEGAAETRLDVHHAWLFEDLPGGRVRILTQETQIGKPAQDLARTKPNPMLNAHQEWIDGLANASARS